MSGRPHAEVHLQFGRHDGGIGRSNLHVSKTDPGGSVLGGWLYQLDTIAISVIYAQAGRFEHPARRWVKRARTAVRSLRRRRRRFGEWPDRMFRSAVVDVAVACVDQLQQHEIEEPAEIFGVPDRLQFTFWRNIRSADRACARLSLSHRFSRLVTARSGTPDHKETWDCSLAHLAGILPCPWEGSDGAGHVFKNPSRWCPVRHRAVRGSRSGLSCENRMKRTDAPPVPKFSLATICASARIQSRSHLRVCRAGSQSIGETAILSTKASAKIKTRQCQSQARTTQTTEETTA
jgi:hypothetical protein